MIHDNAVVGAPLTLYKDTKANIEALSLTEGDTFWATDLDIEGYYDGANVIWRPNDAGWVYDAVTWTFASTTTFTVSGDVTDRFETGTKIKLTQTTNKYFYVVSSSYSSPNTTVTITGGSDYTLANAAISNPAYSYASPPDFPGWFNYVPAFTGFSTDPTGTFRFKMRENNVTLIVFMSSTGTSNATSFTMTAPIAAAFTMVSNTSRSRDNGTYQTASGLVLFSAGSTIAIFRTLSAVGWTASGGKSASFEIDYFA